MSTNVTRRIRGHAEAFWADEGAQSLLEYGLLAAVIAAAGILIFPAVASRMATIYNGWGTAAAAAWEPPAPGGGS